MTDLPHPMKAWIDANSSQAKIARAVGCSQPHLSLILAGKKEPSIGLAKRLSELTDGVVPMEAFAAREARA